MCLMCEKRFDTAKGDAFAGRMLQNFNAASTVLMTSIGHRTGLFDVMGDGNARSSQELADAAGLAERYVREWLGAMVCGKIVDYDPATQTYTLPAEHAAFLTRAASPNNLGATAQWFAVLGGVEDQVAGAFRHGRGVPYSAYNRFHEVMAEESNQTTIGGLDQHIIPLVKGLEAQLHRGIDVCDVGCGSGLAMLTLATRFPNSRFVGIDLSDATVAAANNRAAERGLSNVKFESRDLTTWNATGSFDLITAFDAIHDQGRPDLVLRNIARALRIGGTFLMQDIKASSHVEKNVDHVLAPFIYTISCMHCMSVSLAQGGMGLGAAWGVELAQTMLADAGFANVTVNDLPHDILNTYYVCRLR